MLVLKRKSYLVLLVVLAAAVVVAAWKNVRPEDLSGVLEEENRSVSIPNSIHQTKKQESLVGVWIPYMSLQADGTENGFKVNFDKKLTAAIDAGANAVFVHVRPFADSVYPSAYEPWSHVLTGTQGTDPGYDPLEYMVTKTHEAGLSFHAWINPLRISTGSTPDVLADSSFYHMNKEKNPHYFMEYEGGIYYNPAVSVIRERIADSAAEIVFQYEVDGIHFDDYFYPAAVESLDRSSYQAYADSTEHPLSLTDWRTANINALITAVYRKIKQADAETLFGISPQGNIENNKAICADTYTWCVQKGYIDYICPQLYYSFDNPGLSFGDALAAWTQISRADGVKLYIGLAAYKAGTDADGGTWLHTEDVLAKQIELAAESGAEGIVLYAVDHLESEAAHTEMKNARKAIRKCFS